MKTNSPGCGCCTKQFNIQKLHAGTGRILWRRRVPDNKLPLHDLYEVRTCSDGSFVVCDIAFPLADGIFRGDRRISSSATSTISKATNQFDDPNYVCNFNAPNLHLIDIKHIDPVDEDYDIRDLIFTTADEEVGCNYASDFTRKWKRRFVTSTGHQLKYSSWNDVVVVWENTGYFHLLDPNDGSDTVERFAIPYAPFAGGYVPGSFIQDTSEYGILVMAAAQPFICDWEGNLLLVVANDLFGAGTGWRVGCFSADGEHFYFATGVLMVKLTLDGTVVWSAQASRYTETGIFGFGAGQAFHCVELPDGGVVLAGEGFLMPQKDNDPQFDDSGFLIEYEYKNTLCFEPDGTLRWTHREEGQDHFGGDGEPTYIAKQGLTISDDGHVVVTNKLFTPANLVDGPT